MLKFTSLIVEPLSRRISGYLGTTLTVLGLASGEISTVLAAVPVVVGVLVDLVASNFNKKRSQ